MKCPRCQAENPAGQRFCGACGARLGSVCAACGAANAPGQKFCGECGAPLTQAAGTAKSASPESYTPRHLAEKILTSKSALEGERKQVTVLFADLKGSMELLADRDPEEARKLLDPVLERMMEAVHRYEGTVNQVMGDGIMALFGAPLAHEDHAVRACYAALWMQEAVTRYAEEARHAHGVNVQIRVGLNSGEVVVRAIGSDLHMDYTAVGQTTHLAARMEQLASPGSILLTASTLTLVEGFVAVKPLGPVPVKGLADPVEVYEVTGAGLARTRLQAATRRGLTRFVGRDTELEQLRRAQQLAGDGHGQVAAIVGEAGVGKSRLVYEFTHSHRLQGWLTLESASVSYGKATSYLPVIDLLKGYFKIQDRDDVREIREKVTGKLLTLDRALEPTLPALLALLDVPVDDAAWRTLDPGQRRQQTLDAVRRLLLREAREQPLLLIFEDLHWIDGETQAVLDTLVESLGSARLLLLVNYRPEYQHAWGSKTSYSQMRLDALPAESAGELLDALLGDDPGLGPLKQLLVKRGNPFFLEETVRTLVETKALAGEHGRYQLTQPVQAIQVPPTVQVMLAARIDRLAPEDKRLLQTASVVGKDVPFALLQAIAELPEGALRGGLDHLQAAEFLYETGLYPDLEYAFTHALTHDVTYGGLLQERRRELHTRIVDAMETLYRNRLGEHVERLAHHSLHGALAAKAVVYLREAGAKAAARSANREAVGFFAEALNVLAGLPETRQTLNDGLEIRLAMGPAMMSMSGPGATEVLAIYTEARALCDRLGEHPQLFPVLWGLWYINTARGQLQTARELGEQLLEVARTTADDALRLEAHHCLWSTCFVLGDLRAVRPHFEQGLKLYDLRQHRTLAFLYGGHDPGVCCRMIYGCALAVLGHFDQALGRSEDALALAREVDHPLTTIVAHYYAGWVRHQRGERAEAVRTAQAAVALATTHGFNAWRAWGETLLAAVTADDAGDDLIARLERALDAARAGLWGWKEVWSLGPLVAACARQGHVARGLQVLSEMSAQEHVLDFCGAELQRLTGELLLASDSPAAEASFRQAIAIARTRAEKSTDLRATISLARLLQRLDRRREARDLLADVYDWFTEGFDTADLVAAKALLAELAR